MLSPPIRLKSLEDTARLAEALAAVIQAPTQIGLVGGLGAGKTTLGSYLVKALGSKEAVSSPTFVLCHEYSAAGLIIEHWDLYRLSGAPDELLSGPDPDTIRLIEWPDRDAELSDSLDIKVELKVSYEPDELRTASLSGDETLVKSITETLAKLS